MSKMHTKIFDRKMHTKFTIRFYTNSHKFLIFEIHTQITKLVIYKRVIKHLSMFTYTNEHVYTPVKKKNEHVYTCIRYSLISIYCTFFFFLWCSRKKKKQVFPEKNNTNNPRYEIDKHVEPSRHSGVPIPAHIIINP